MNEDKMRKDFEAILAKDCGDLSTFGTGANMHYKNSYVNHEWIGYKMGHRAATRAAASVWQPIETAPKDGTNVLLLNQAGNMACGMWMESRGLGTGWFLRGGSGPDLFFNYHYGPSHWMPLPPAPEEKT